MAGMSEAEAGGEGAGFLGAWRRAGEKRRIGFVAAAILALSAYFTFVNLDYARLWHDEGTNALMARAIVYNGNISGWDGRNLFFGVREPDKFFGINDDLSMVAYPPWPALASAAGIFVFGDNELGIRFPHALLGFLSAVLFWMLLQLHFPNRPRLRLIALAVVALSPLMILYARQGRYYADALFFTLLCFYCYQRFWRGGHVGWLAGMALAAVLNFLNHFAVGFSAALAIALWHLLYCRRQTTKLQWIQLAGAGAATAAACGGWLLYAGVLGSNLEYGGEFYEFSWLKRRVYLLFFYFRDSMRTNWLPVAVAIWWGWYAVWPFLRRVWAWINSGDNKKKKKKKKAGADFADSALNSDSDSDIKKWSALALLMLAATSLVSVQTVENHHVADMRYAVMALPFFLFMSAVFADWAWAKNKTAGGVLLAVLMLSNLGSYPVLFRQMHNYYGCPSETYPLAAMAREIHRPYPTTISETLDFLQMHARQDETISVHPLPDYAVLMYYLSHKLFFCCRLLPGSPLPEEKIRSLGAPTYAGDAEADWWVVMGPQQPPGNYQLAYVGEYFAYPTNRPEWEYRCFKPAQTSGVHIYRRVG